MCNNCEGCPFAMTDKSEQIQNYGCLPTPRDIVTMRVKYNKTWACHETGTTPCIGSIEFLKEHNMPFKVIDKELLNEQSQWHLYVE